MREVPRADSGVVIMVAEFERSIIRERQAEGIALAQMPPSTFAW